MRYEAIKTKAVLEAIQMAGGNLSRACKLIGISRSSIYRIAKRNCVIWKKKKRQDDFDGSLALIGIQSHENGIPRSVEAIYDDARAHVSALCFLLEKSSAVKILEAWKAVKNQLAQKIQQ